jgi:hypothetical protein
VISEEFKSIKLRQMFLLSKLHSSYHCLEINPSGENHDDCDYAEEDAQNTGDDCSCLQTVAATTRVESFHSHFVLLLSDKLA